MATFRLIHSDPVRSYLDDSVRVDDVLHGVVHRGDLLGLPHQLTVP